MKTFDMACIIMNDRLCQCPYVFVVMIPCMLAEARTSWICELNIANQLV